MVEVKNVSKQYGGKSSLRKRLYPFKGQAHLVYRSERRGKSTLLSIMSRLIKTDSGEITVDGQEIGACKSNDLAKKSAS